MQIQFNINESKLAIASMTVSRFNQHTGSRLTIKGWGDLTNAIRAALGSIQPSIVSSRVGAGRLVKSKEDGIRPGFTAGATVNLKLEMADAPAPLVCSVLIGEIIKAESAALESWKGFKVGIPEFTLGAELADWVAKFESAPAPAVKDEVGGTLLGGVIESAPAPVPVAPAIVGKVKAVKAVKA